MLQFSIRHAAPVVAAMVVSAGAAQAQGLFGYAGGDNDLYSVNASGPTATFIGNDSNSGILAEIEWGGGFIWGADTGVNTNLHKIDPATGQVVGTLTLTFPTQGDVLTALEFVGSTLYAGLTTEGGGETYLATVDTVGGTVTSIGATGAGSPLGGLAFDGTTMYGITSGGSAATLYTIHLGTGAGTSVGQVTLNGTTIGATALEFGTDGVLYALPNPASGNAGSLLTIDPGTAVATNLGDLGVPGMNALTAVPEPATLTVLGVASLLGFARRRRRG
ncbi:MAG: PEP-CTERM sorting domain-containing protein [Fimbriimonadaceae bacterium]|nr:PEP-CTERM sorting domain-containing protein [Fimbriimonadaceae bacterium]